MKIHNFALLPLLTVFSLTIFLSACAPKQALERDQAQIDQLVVENRIAIESCYEEAVKKNPKIGTGTISVRVDHLPDGRLVNPRRLRGFEGADPVVKCIREILSNWKTDRPYTRGPVDLVWSFKRNSGNPNHQEVVDVSESESIN